MENDRNEESIESLITEFNTCGKVAAEHLVRKCRTVARAKAKGKNGFEKSCAKAKLKPGSST